MQMNSFSLLLVALVGACGRASSSHGSSPPPVEVEEEDVTLTFFRSFESGTYVFRGQAELDGAWAAAPFRLYPVGIVDTEPAKPTYDYSKQMVVGLSQGVGKWCFKPNIFKVEQSGADTIVSYRVSTRSTLACLRDGPLIAFALVPQADGEVSFVQDFSEGP